MFFKEKEKKKLDWSELVGKRVVYCEGYMCEDFVGFSNNSLKEGNVERTLGKEAVMIDGVWYREWFLQFYGVIDDSKKSSN